MSAEDTGRAESGTLPGRYEWVEEPTEMGIPTDPEWNRFSDNMRQWIANAGNTTERNDGLGTPDAVSHGRGMEEPEATIAYDKQLFDVNDLGEPQTAEAYGWLRDDYNRIHGTLLCVGRIEDAGGNFDSGIRSYTVIRGTKFSTVTETLDPSENNPILVECEANPGKVRSYIIHQPGSTIDLTFTSQRQEDVGTDITVEDEGASTSETVTFSEVTDADGNFDYAEATTSSGYDDIDSIWFHDNPVGDVEVTDGSGTIVAESTGSLSSGVIAGGLTYSDDDQPVDGDRGVPPTGAGSHADPIGGSFEYFIGDLVQHPDGTPYRPRINSLEVSVENSIEGSALHHTRAPANDAANRTISISADVAGPRATHDSMMEALQKQTFGLGHELSGGVREFPALLVQEGGEREYDGEDQAVAAVSETLEATDNSSVQMHAGQTFDEVFGS